MGLAHVLLERILNSENTLFVSNPPGKNDRYQFSERYDISPQ